MVELRCLVVAFLALLVVAILEELVSCDVVEVGRAVEELERLVSSVVVIVVARELTVELNSLELLPSTACEQTANKGTSTTDNNSHLPFIVEN